MSPQKPIRSKSPQHREQNNDTKKQPTKPQGLKTNDKPQKSKQNDLSQQTRQKIVLLGDSHYNQIDEMRLRKRHYVQVRNHPGASSTDLLDHLKPVLRNSPPDRIIYHGACNDLVNKDIDTIQNLKEMVKIIQETSSGTKLSISLLLPRNDEDGMRKKVDELNNRIKSFCVDNKIDIISNSNVRAQHLGKKQVHLKGEGLRIFAGNIVSHIRKLN